MIAVLSPSLPTYPRNKNTLRLIKDIGKTSIIPVTSFWRPYQRYFPLNIFLLVWQVFTRSIPREATHVVILFPDHELVVLAAMYRFLWRRSYVIVFDPLISIYDTYVFNKPLARGFIWKRLVWLYERWVWNLADSILIDTLAHGQYINKLLKTNFPFAHLPLSADEDIFKPTNVNNLTFWKEAPLRVIWYGRTSGMHGVEYILQAFHLLENQPITLTIIGSLGTIDKNLIDPLIKNGQLTYISTDGNQLQSLQTIGSQLAHHHVCLGVFGATDKASHVIANKECEALAAARCLITRQGAKAPLLHEKNCILVNINSPAELAENLKELSRDRLKLQRLAKEGRKTYETYFSTTSTTKHILNRLFQ